ncbi:hypothetical protein CA54_45820 [Symmachiella macrocystis]|uniref:Uncharacterized protein n=1 Tax=Symmachiella macrocystis TaxID=2527985 RepID=A0A5C6BCV7_9PLAN|nr:hypothetical protein [Symmachiella macrocystis]TWU09341.1 hypothetical protein CA54_45820 [Symmachiella macrocystis]
MTTQLRSLAVWKWGLLLLLWCGCLYGVLRVTEIPGDWGHWICGPWGCGPKLQALVACHGFWLVLLAPPTIIFCAALPTRQVRLIGTLLAGWGAAAVLIVTLIQGWTWLPVALHPIYFGQRVLFCIATTVEIPIVQFVCIGLLLRYLAKSRDRREAAEGDRANELEA